jgi:transcriptional regulator with PAS, ATPase and Fis domain
VATTEATVLVTGETGTGKELVAETIHTLSRRHKEPFLPINCGAVSPTLIESELFGHERGSFTGADRLHRGYFERATRGSLFLDEITEMPELHEAPARAGDEQGHAHRRHRAAHRDVRMIVTTNRRPEEVPRASCAKTCSPPQRLSHQLRRCASARKTWSCWPSTPCSSTASTTRTRSSRARPSTA